MEGYGWSEGSKWVRMDFVEIRYMVLVLTLSTKCGTQLSTAPVTIWLSPPRLDGFLPFWVACCKPVLTSNYMHNCNTLKKPTDARTHTQPEWYLHQLAIINQCIWQCFAYSNTHVATQCYVSISLHTLLLLLSTHISALPSPGPYTRMVGPLMPHLSHCSHLYLMLCVTVIYFSKWRNSPPHFPLSKPTFEKISTLHKVF